MVQLLNCVGRRHDRTILSALPIVAQILTKHKDIIEKDQDLLHQLWSEDGHISRWNVPGLLHNPNDIRLYSNNPIGVARQSCVHPPLQSAPEHKQIWNLRWRRSVILVGCLNILRLWAVETPLSHFCSSKDGSPHKALERLTFPYQNCRTGIGWLALLDYTLLEKFL